MRVCACVRTCVSACRCVCVGTIIRISLFAALFQSMDNGVVGETGSHVVRRVVLELDNASALAPILLRPTVVERALGKMWKLVRVRSPCVGQVWKHVCI